MGWKPIDSLVMDGRQVMFKAPAGEFEAPAVEPYAPTIAERTRMFKHDGTWPNVKYNPTHWKEL